MLKKNFYRAGIHAELYACTCIYKYTYIYFIKLTSFSTNIVFFQVCIHTRASIFVKLAQGGRIHAAILGCDKKQKKLSKVCARRVERCL